MRISLTKYGGLLPFPGGRKYLYDSSTAAPDKQKVVEKLIDAIDFDQLEKHSSSAVPDSNSYLLHIEKDNGEDMDKKFSQADITDSLDKLMQFLMGN